MKRNRPHLPSLNALRAFEAAARHLNFRLAAGELGVTQGAVAQHVRGLEADLGLKFFDRLPRALALTDQGRIYAAQIRRAFELIVDATGALYPEPLQLTISVTPTFASKWLIPHLPHFTEAHPDIDLRILARESLADFQSDGVDIAVRQGRPPFGAGLDADLLFEQDLVAICSPALLTHPPRPLRPDEIGRFPLLIDAHDLWPAYIEEALQQPYAAAAKRVRFNQTALAIDAAIAGQGLALASRFLVRSDLASGRLAQAFAAVMRGSADYYVVSPRKPRRPGPTAMVRTWLLQQRG
jgi:LysR family glycine cleavage system transcriptional activator